MGTNVSTRIKHADVVISIGVRDGRDSCMYMFVVASELYSNTPRNEYVKG